MQCMVRKGSSCLGTTLLLREAIAHATEHGSTAHVVLLDVKKAFDTVWIEELFYQLRILGVDKVLWWTLRSYYTDFKCAVLLGGNQSMWFNVSQGEHQGAVSSMIF